MIYDSLEHIDRYLGINKNLDTAIHFIMTHDVHSFPVGRYDIDDKVYFSSQEYIAKDIEEIYFEIHKHHIDIQLILEGKEMMLSKEEGSEMKPISDWDSSKDMQYFERNADYACDKVVSGDHFAIFFNGEYHLPGIKVNNETVKKLLFKIEA